MIRRGQSLHGLLLSCSTAPRWMSACRMPRAAADAAVGVGERGCDRCGDGWVADPSEGADRVGAYGFARVADQFGERRDRLGGLEAAERAGGCLAHDRVAVGGDVDQRVDRGTSRAMPPRDRAEPCRRARWRPRRPPTALPPACPPTNHPRSAAHSQHGKPHAGIPYAGRWIGLRHR